MGYPNLNLTDDQTDLVQVVTSAFDRCKPHHDRWRANAEKRYALYRSYHKFRGDWQDTAEPDRDEFWQTSRSTFGADLFIPYCFTVVETIVPRMLSHRPKLLVLPRNPDSEKNIQPVQELMDAQQEQIRYELTLQRVCKSGLIYGLGIQKTCWRKEVSKRKMLAPAVLAEADAPAWAPREATVVTFDDPDVESVDPFDFFWDAYGSDMRTVEYVIHRTWRSSKYVRRMLESEQWQGLAPEDIHDQGSRQKYDEVWEMRRESAGFGGVQKQDPNLHEVLEYHDGDRVITVLDREVPVQAGENPYWHGEIPFQIFRPTVLDQEFAGIGEIEPLEDLQAEMNTLRSQRRDNATLVLQRPIAYWQGLVDPDVIRFGPAELIPTPGDPRELLMPLQVGDIPASGYQEEQNLQSDIERVSGISDPISGGEGAAAQTATGVQLIQQAASIRIKNKTRLMEAELMAPAAKQMLEMNQQKIISERTVRIPQPGGYGADQRWSWRNIGPIQLAGEFDVVPEGGSTEAENVPQQRQDAQMMWQMLSADPQVDRLRLLNTVLDKLGVRVPEAWILPPPALDPRVMQGALELIQNQDPKLVGQALQISQQQLMQTSQATPGQNGGGPPQEGQAQQEEPQNAGR